MCFMLELAVGAVWIQGAVQETLGLAVHQLAWVIAFMALLYLLAPIGAWFLAGRPVEHGRCWEKLARASGRIGLCVPLCLHVHERVEANTVGLFRPRVFVTTGMVSTLDEDELSAILAHEATHAAERHVLAMLAAGCLFASASQLTGSVELFLVGFLSLLGLRRWFEYRADAGASKAVGQGVTTACLSRLQEIYRHTRFDRAVMFLTPHPTLPKRMEAVQRGRMALI